MPRRRPPKGPYADDPGTIARVEKWPSRFAYLVTNRHRLHEAATVVTGLVQDRTLPASHVPPDVHALARDVDAWKAMRGLSWDHEDDYWHTREAIKAVRPGAYAEPVHLHVRGGGGR